MGSRAGSSLQFEEYLRKLARIYITFNTHMGINGRALK